MLLAVAGLVRDEGDLLALGLVQPLALASVGVIAGEVVYRMYEAEHQRMMKRERHRQRERRARQ